jgi:hypothetical protein
MTGLAVGPGCDEYIYTGNIFRGNGTNVVDNGGPHKVVGSNLLTT